MLLCFVITLSVTGVLLRSDVFVDIISEIEIVTTTRELLLGESPEVCHIQAFDSKGKKQLTAVIIYIMGEVVTLWSFYAGLCIEQTRFESWSGSLHCVVRQDTVL